MAKKPSKRRSSPLRMRPVATNCPFCKEKKEPDYKNTGELGCYITDRGKIIGKGRTGLCAKHQRRIARAIKRARQIGLLPFGGSLS